MPIKRQAVGAQLQAAFQRPLAVLVDAPDLRAYLRQPVVFFLVRTENRRVQEGDPLVEHGRVARDADVVCNNQRQEDEIVGNARADAATCGRVPPVLHVAFLELPRRRAQDLCPRLLRGAVDDGHRVLELVAETECPARLVERRPAPHSTGERLVYEPAVQHQVHRRVRCADLDRPEDAIPERADFLQRRLHPARRGVGADESPGLVRGLGLPEQEDDLLLPARRHVQRRHQCGARVDQFAGAAGEPRPAEGGRRFRRALAAQEFGAIGREGTRRGIRTDRGHGGESDPPGEVARPGVGGEQRAGFRVGRAHHLRGGLVAEAAQDPLGVERRRQAPRPACPCSARRRRTILTGSVGEIRTRRSCSRPWLVRVKRL